MTSEKLARIQTHLDNEAAGSHPQGVMDRVLLGLIEDASEPPSGVMDVVEPAESIGDPATASDHASGGEAPCSAEPPRSWSPIMPNPDRCSWEQCRNWATMTYLTRPLCAMHWHKWCMIDEHGNTELRKSALARMGLCERNGQVVEITHATDDAD